MTILLTNDDGFGAEGIQLLENALTNAGHEVWVCAPEEQRSGFSHSVSLKTPVRMTKVSERHYTCSGSPADCVMYFMLGDFPLKKPDMIISGINNGFNIGYDVLYSGTVGSATEGTFRDIPSIAISAQDGEGVKVPFEDAAEFLVKHIDDFYPIINQGSFININVPINSNQKWGLSFVDYVEYYDHILTQKPENVYHFKGEARPENVKHFCEGSDFDLVSNKHLISVSALRVMQNVDLQMQKKLEELI